MLRRLIASSLVAFSLAAGFHASVSAKRPLYVECRDTVLQAAPILVVIQNFGDGKLRDAVRHCRETLGGHPAGGER